MLMQGVGQPMRGDRVKSRVKRNHLDRTGRGGVSFLDLFDVVGDLPDRLFDAFLCLAEPFYKLVAKFCCFFHLYMNPFGKSLSDKKSDKKTPCGNKYPTKANVSAVPL